ncbi:hypothetical protein ACWD4T_47100, partial [Streptomyces umbrinus]
PLTGLSPEKRALMELCRPGALSVAERADGRADKWLARLSSGFVRWRSFRCAGRGYFGGVRRVRAVNLVRVPLPF